MVTAEENRKRIQLLQEAEKRRREDLSEKHTGKPRKPRRSPPDIKLPGSLPFAPPDSR